MGRRPPVGALTRLLQQAEAWAVISSFLISAAIAQDASNLLVGASESLVKQDAAECQSEAWALQNKNWTDGDPNAPKLSMCTLLPITLLEGKPAQDCSTMFAIPKVAMLFLTMGSMRHEALWAMWFKQASLTVPRDCLSAALCQENKPAPIVQDFADCLKSRRGILNQQVLFSVYVHPPPGYEGYSEDSLFYNSEIADRVNSSWGTFDLAQVARNLMKASLEDPLNQRFMTISESCIPLYSPSVVYNQLMYNEKSRINACTTRENWGRDEYRWSFRIEEAMGGRLTKDMWRKNHQWLALTRKHARLTVADQEVASAFSKHCFSGKDPDFGGWWRTCFSDEHYFSTLLAFHGLDEETDCMGELTHTFWCSWCSGDERLHPKTYKPEETDVNLLRELRQESSGCNAERSLQAATQLLVGLPDLTAPDSCGEPLNASAALLPSKCPLFARKFSNGSSAAAMHAVFSLILQDESREQRRRVAACTGGLPGNSSITANLSGVDPDSQHAVAPTTSKLRSQSGGLTRESIFKTVEGVIRRNQKAARNSTRMSKRQARRRNRVKQGNL